MTIKMTYLLVMPVFFSGSCFITVNFLCSAGFVISGTGSLISATASSSLLDVPASGCDESKGRAASA